jgi:hypothetical protein
MIQLNNIDNYCERQTVTKIDNVLLYTRRSFLGRWLYRETAKFQQAEIINNTKIAQFYQLTIQQGASFNEELERLPNIKYTPTLTFTVNKMNKYERDRFEQFVRLDDICFIFGDENGYWLIGETDGARTNITTNSNDEANNYTVTASTIERWPIRAVKKEFVEILKIGEPPIYDLCSTSWDSLCATSWAALCASDWGS